MYMYVYVCIDEYMYVCMFVCMNVCMNVCMHAWMYVCMYVYMYVHICIWEEDENRGAYTGKTYADPIFLGAYSHFREWKSSVSWHCSTKSYS